jgi:hypothetical protein
MDNDPIAEERARLVAQLRTSLLDPLALLAAQAAAFEQAAGQDERQRAAFAVVAALARQALQRARDLEADLDDARLEQLGLEASLDMLCGRAMRASPASVELSLPRLEVMATMGEVSLPLSVLRGQIADAFDLVLHQEYCPDGRRRLTRVCEVVGTERDQIVLSDIFRHDESGFYATGHRPSFLGRLKARGVEVDPALFA